MLSALLHWVPSATFQPFPTSKTSCASKRKWGRWTCADLCRLEPLGCKSPPCRCWPAGPRACGALSGGCNHFGPSVFALVQARGCSKMGSLGRGRANQRATTAQLPFTSWGQAFLMIKPCYLRTMRSPKDILKPQRCFSVPTY